MPPSTDRTVEKLLRQQAALARFGTFAFKETDLQAILMEAARVCASSLDVPFCKICRYRAVENDLLIEAGCGWAVAVVGRVVSRADETSPQGRAYVSGQPVIIGDVRNSNKLVLPDFYEEHGIISTVDVIIAAKEGTPYGVLEIDSPTLHQYDEHDINFLTGFANVLAEAVATAQRNKAVRDLVDQQRLLAEELQHRVRNNLQFVTMLLETYARANENDTARAQIDGIARLVMTLAQVYDSLLGVGLSDSIDLADYLRRICDSLPGLPPGRGGNVTLNFTANAVMMPLDSVTMIGMIVAELVTNCYRHAFPESGGAIDVTLTRAPTDGRAVLTIRDDGVGFRLAEAASRRGMGLVRKLSDQMGGTLEVRSMPGTVWTLKFSTPDGNPRGSGDAQGRPAG